MDKIESLVKEETNIVFNSQVHDTGIPIGILEYGIIQSGLVDLK